MDFFAWLELATDRLEALDRREAREGAFSWHEKAREAIAKAEGEDE